MRHLEGKHAEPAGGRYVALHRRPDRAVGRSMHAASVDLTGRRSIDHTREHARSSFARSPNRVYCVISSCLCTECAVVPVCRRLPLEPPVAAPLAQPSRLDGGVEAGPWPRAIVVRQSSSYAGSGSGVSTSLARAPRLLAPPRGRSSASVGGGMRTSPAFALLSFHPPPADPGAARFDRAAHTHSSHAPG